ncbi:hypothetical protein B0H14DRAFT_3868846 [Mycena olivaceomarginata]|nr:hypothetical protein B0H14DRAFT_3868846 [Mycena olivaceomarginata]
MRFENLRRDLLESDIMIFGHDYTIPEAPLPGDTIEEDEEVEEVPAPRRQAKGRKAKAEMEDDEGKEVPAPRRQAKPRKAKTKGKGKGQFPQVSWLCSLWP